MGGIDGKGLGAKVNQMRTGWWYYGGTSKIEQKLVTSPSHTASK